MKIFVLFLVISYVFWVCFLAFSGYKAATDAKRQIPAVTMMLLCPFGIFAVALDVFYNLTFAIALFLELPRTWTLTARCDSHLKETSWRGAMARWLCANLLDPFQQGGHCK